MNSKKDAAGRKRFHAATKNAKKVLRVGDRVRVTKCPGTKRTITFSHWDGPWIVSKSGIDDYSATTVDRVNGIAVNFLPFEDSYGKIIGEGSTLGLALVGFSGSGCTQHIRLAEVIRVGEQLVVVSDKSAPAHPLKNVPLRDILREAEKVKVLTEAEAEAFPHGETMRIFNNRYPF